MVPSNAPYVWYTIKDLLRQLERKGLGIIDRPPNTYWQKKSLIFLQISCFFIFILINFFRCNYLFYYELLRLSGGGRDVTV